MFHGNGTVRLGRDSEGRDRAPLELEMTLPSWHNHYTCDIFAEKGNAGISALCKRRPTTSTHRTRVLPSGQPLEDNVTLEQEDPTWALEYAHYRQLCERGAAMAK